MGEFILPSFEIIEQEPGVVGMFKHIEKIARISYQSQNKITEDSALSFVDRLIKNKHGAALEHGSVYLHRDNAPTTWINKYKDNPYSKVVTKNTDIYNVLVTTNYRVIIENGWIDDIKYFTNNVPINSKRITVKFILDIGTLREFFRHRKFSMLQESTRYVNYEKKGLKFILPKWFESFDLDDPLVIRYCAMLTEVENNYNTLIKSGLKPQDARCILPLCTKSEAAMTGLLEDWNAFFELRCANNAHPDAKYIADKLKEELNNYINANISTETNC